ncbi:hypothetical protein [Frankia sp. QA3]|uniref:hypothetical protein n=1 Tax=Frankia sp. QA3 TaxID=710111 RepID=UPI0012FA7188|nr:hypothetical protein [Frankia sp. QA3]
MLGHSNAGKTTYLTAAYYAMQHDPRIFQISAGRRDHRRLMRSGRVLAAGRGYPPPSDARSVHEFVASRDGIDPVEISWIDHRGGAAVAKTADGQARRLQEDLSAADAVLLFGDAERLVGHTHSQREIDTLVPMLLRAFGDRGGSSTIPFAVLITKVDALGDALDELRPALHRPFTALMDGVRRAEWAVARSFEVACGPSARNVVEPLLWIMQAVIDDRIDTHYTGLDASLATMRTKVAEDKVSARFRAHVNGVPTGQAIVRGELEKAIGALAALRPLHTVARELAAALAHLGAVEPDGAPEGGQHQAVPS